MIKEMADQLQLLKTFHSRMDKFMEGLTDEQWVTKPHPLMNNIASIIVSWYRLPLPLELSCWSIASA